MKTIKEEIEAQIIEKKSKFICNIYCVNSKEEAEEILNKVRKKYHDAKHHCYAYRIIAQTGIIEKASDDGEPSGTAGQPMLNLLVKNDLVNCIAVVTRYFGGILLGTGGLVRAYSGSMQEALNNAILLELQLGVEIKIYTDYQNLPILEKYCQKNNISIINKKFEEQVCLILQLTEQENYKMDDEIQKRNLKIQEKEEIRKIFLKK